ncbi:MAG TPA: response regulator transcription factor [Ktedonobacterales bacterium]
MSAPIRILVADDHPIVRDGLVAILSAQSSFEVVGEASDGVETLRQVVERKPDVVLLDLEMPRMDGVEVLQRLRQSGSSARVIVFTAFDTDDRILAAVRAGAQGYLLKGAPRDEIYEAVRIVHSGASLLQPVVASRLLRRVSDDSVEAQGVRSLTSRELEVLRLVMRGLQNKEIAHELVVTERTVKFHVSSILMKLGAGNRTEAVAIATKYGLGK